MNLHWKRPLVYLLLPILVFLCFVGFPPPFAPPQGRKAPQAQTEVVGERQQGEPAGR